VGLKYKLGYDDSLDVVGVHLVAGLWGTIGAGLLAVEGGLFYGGGVDQTVVQILIALAAVTVSGVVRLVKPDRAIYDHHIAAFGLEPEATFFTDDSPANIEAAKAAGWTAFLFEGPDKLTADLRSCGIAI